MTTTRKAIETCLGTTQCYVTTYRNIGEANPGICVGSDYCIVTEHDDGSRAVYALDVNGAIRAQREGIPFSVK